jgi:3-hydroxyisobutyrate dehydrogenase-like beta-hydroxyacid dehydrogenase
LVKPKLRYDSSNNRKVEAKVGVNPTLTKTVNNDHTDLVAYIITKSDVADIIFMPQSVQPVRQATQQVDSSTGSYTTSRAIHRKLRNAKMIRTIILSV